MTEKKERLWSLDALRGADMIWIMGFSTMVVAACEMSGFGRDCWLAKQMTHVAWHGLRQHDTIFPLFLFLAGVSWPFSLAGQSARGFSTARICLRIAKRAFMLFLLGIVSTKLFAFDFANVRYDSVLAHIGVCWAGAAYLFLALKTWKLRLLVAFAMLAAHWCALFFFAAPDAAALRASADPGVAGIVGSYVGSGTDGFSFTGNIAGWIDRVCMPGVLHEKVFDPDGLLAKVSGIPLALFGMMAGDLLRHGAQFSGGRKALMIAAAGVAATALCAAWMPWCPVNKKLWTPTFVLASAAYSCLLLAAFYWIVDVKGWRRWTFFFRVIGMNAITIYMLMRIVWFGSISRLFFSGVAHFGGKPWEEFVFAAGALLIEWLVLLFLHSKKTYLRV